MHARQWLDIDYSTTIDTYLGINRMSHTVCALSPKVCYELKVL